MVINFILYRNNPLGENHQKTATERLERRDLCAMALIRKGVIFKLGEADPDVAGTVHLIGAGIIAQREATTPIFGFGQLQMANIRSTAFINDNDIADFPSELVHRAFGDIDRETPSRRADAFGVD